MKLISNKEIQEAAECNPQRALLMCLANNNIKNMNKKETKLHEPLFHPDGWSIAFHTNKGIVGLWSCWLSNRIVLCYPLSQEKLTDDIILKHFDLEISTAVPFENNQRKWSEYYGRRTDVGRVWFQHERQHSYGYHFKHFTDFELNEMYYGHGHSQVLATYPFDFYYGKYEDCPTTKSEHIQKYRDLFIQFVLNNWKVHAITIQFNNVLVPQQLSALGYAIKWLKGNENERNCWGDQLVQGTKKDEYVFLQSANSLVPWITIRHFPYKNQSIEEILTF